MSTSPRLVRASSGSAGGNGQWSQHRSGLQHLTRGRLARFLGLDLFSLFPRCCCCCWSGGWSGGLLLDGSGLLDGSDLGGLVCLLRLSWQSLGGHRDEVSSSSANWESLTAVHLVEGSVGTSTSSVERMMLVQ